jgi:two-component system CheB/CheR fusion protein
MPPGRTDVRVVGIGASAGSVDAYSRLLAALPPDTGLAYVLVPHLSPTHHSELSQLLARVTAMPVTEAVEGEALQPNHVYVLPSDKVMSIGGGRLRLESRDPRDVRPTVIDHFLDSLARELGPEAIGIVLSGTGADGTVGLQAIKRRGGTTFAQDFASAAYEGMPRSAVEAGAVDFTLPPEAIAQTLAELTRPERFSSSDAQQPDSLAHTDQAETAPPPVHSDEEAAALERILELLSDATGVDFRHYKRPSLARRVHRRIEQLALANLASYIPLLERSDSEIAALFDSVLIQVTRFFRDPASFEVLQSTVIPPLIASRAGGTPLRVWVVGCAMGQEAYSTAITFLETMTALGREFPLRVFATDLSESALETARLGRYPADIVEDVSPERLERFFVSVDGGFQVQKQLREMCVFARHDVTRQPPFAQLDFVICRNMLIYLEPVLQRRVLYNFHYALNPGAFLALGSAEGVGELHQFFSPLHRKHKIYLRRSVPSRLHLEPDLPLQHQLPVMNANAAAPMQRGGAELQQAAEHAFFTQYPSASVIINADLEILHFQGSTSPFLETTSGGPTVHLLRMAHPDLRLVLGRMVRKVQKGGTPVRRAAIPIKVGRSARRVDITVLPITIGDPEHRYCLVVFEPSALEKKERETHRDRTGGGADRKADRAQLLEMRQELVETKEYLQALVDQQDATHAELQAAYEASLSANEEFQSTNEELESTKEELQSLNEELMTVNEQLQQRNAELSARSAEVVGLLEAIEMPILLLDQDLRLHAFNSRAAAEFRLARSSIGRRFGELRSPVPVSDLHELVDRALRERTVQERDVQDAHGGWSTLRLWPVRADGERESTVALALVDIDRLKGDLDRVTTARAYSEAIVETVVEPLVVLDDNLRTLSANRAFHSVFKTQPAQIAGVSLWELGEEWDHPGLRQFVEEVRHDGRAAEGHEVALESARFERRVFRVNARRLTYPGTKVRNILLALEDVTEQKAAEGRLIEARLQAVTQLAGGVAHEINNQMTVALGFTRLLIESGGVPAAQREDLAQVLKAAERAASVTKQLLAFSRRQNLEPFVVDVNALVSAAGPLLQRMVAPEISVDIVLGDAVGQVRVDQAQLEQVLVNLVLNARDAMPHGGRLTIATTPLVVTQPTAAVPDGPRVPPGKYARLMVRDTGTGMDATTKARLFEPFFTTKPVGTGTGLGLATAYGTVKQSGGFIWVDSELGRGTTFAIDLPVVVATPQPATVAEPAAVPGGSESILVAEDEEGVRTWLCRALRQLGYTVLEAGDGQTALRLITEQGAAPDLVLGDAVMPGMGGIELRQRLAAIRPELPVLLISAYSMDELTRRGMVAEGSILSKPLDIRDLAVGIRSVLDA